MQHIVKHLEYMVIVKYFEDACLLYLIYHSIHVCVHCVKILIKKNKGEIISVDYGSDKKLDSIILVS